MSSDRPRTWQSRRTGYVLITFELDPAADELSTVRHRGLADLTARLVEVLSAHRLRATWAVGDPAHSAATAAVRPAAVDHELAILGDASWIGPTAGRTRFARELARRVAQARGAGIHVTSLVPRVASIQHDIDLVVKQGITAVAGVGNECQVRVQHQTPRALHYGVWELPVIERLPLPSSWLPGGGRSLARRLRRAARDAATLHLVIDAPAVERAGSRSERTIARVARRIASLRDRGLVRVETLGTAATRLSHVPAVVPQQSILRRAA